MAEAEAVAPMAGASAPMAEAPAPEAPTVPAAVDPALLLALPDELLVVVLAHTTLAVDLCHAARACLRFLAAAEAASETCLSSENSPMYVPLASWYGRGTPFTWRTRLALGFREAYGSATKLGWLGAGLVVFGSSCAQGESAYREAGCMTDVLNYGPRDERRGEQDANPEGKWQEARTYDSTLAMIFHERPTLCGKGTESSVQGVMRQLSNFVPRHWSETQYPNAFVASFGEEALVVAPASYNAMMSGTISDEIICCPWFLPSSVWTALAITNRPALPAEGPLIAVRTTMRRDDPHDVGPFPYPEAPWRHPQTVIELRDHSRTTVLGRAKLRYSMWPARDKSSPTLWRFRIFSASVSDATLVAAAALADQARPETSRALASVAARGASDARLLAARVLLWHGVEKFCHSHADPTMSHTYPLHAPPEMVPKHGQFLAWRGMKLRAQEDPLASLAGGEWPGLRLGCDDDWWTMNSDDELGVEDDGESENAADAQLSGEEKYAQYLEQVASREAKLQSAHKAAAERLAAEKYDVDKEDEDSEDESEPSFDSRPLSSQERAALANVRLPPCGWW